MNKISVKKIIALKNTRKITMVKAYDFVSGHIVNNSNAEMILVGDSLGMTTLGYEFTSSVKMDDIISWYDKFFILIKLNYFHYK